MAELDNLKGKGPQGRTFRTITFPAAVVLTLWCVVRSMMADALAGPLERVEFESASQPLIPGDRIQGYLAKPEGAGPFPAVVGLHGCAGLNATKQRLTDELVTRGYVTLLVDSFATRGIDQACTSRGFLANARRRTSDAYGALGFLARQTFVDPRRVAAVGTSQGGWVALSVAESNSFELFVFPSHLRFRAVVAFYPPCSFAGARPGIPALILIGAVDDWTPAADCSQTVLYWGTEGPSIEQVVYPGAHHGFYYPGFQPGRILFRHWVEYNGEAADKASRRMLEFLDHHLN